MASGSVHQFLGDTPGRVIVRLLVLSFAVGILLAFFGVEPWEIVTWFRDGVLRIWHMGFAAIGRIGHYFLLGAVVVVPIWLILRLLKAAGGGRS
jgi:hypothetical protein